MSDTKENKSEKELETNEEVSIEGQVKQEIEGETKKELTPDEQVAQERDKFLRLFAEFENYKKRTSRERIELFKSANQELMTVLLPILDDFDRGLNEIRKVKDKELLKGMELINSKLSATLTQKGLTALDSKAGDVFDAEIHEAITQIPAPTEDMKGKIVDVIEKGYKLGDKIIRFPKVVIGQ
jgi:molecular chaperone GrpE